MSSAACVGADPEQFFRADHEADHTARTRAHRLAGVYCARCPIVDTCAALAESYPVEGLWAGYWHERRYSSGAHTHRVYDLLTGDEPVLVAETLPPPPPPPPPAVFCARCGRGPLRPRDDQSAPSRLRLSARGLDANCYVYARTHGELDQYPPVVDHATRAAAYEQLRRAGVTDPERVAAELGVAVATVQQWQRMERAA